MEECEIKKGDKVRYRIKRKNSISEGILVVKNIITEFNHQPVIWYIDKEDLSVPGWKYISHEDVVEVLN